MPNCTRACRLRGTRTAPRNAALLALLALALPVAGAAQQAHRDSPAAVQRLAAFEQYQRLRAESPFRALNWTFVGPVRSTGRMTDVAIHESQPNVIYAASASGGVFKTTDEGASWTPIFDDQATASIGTLALAPSNPDIVWIGTGEANILRSSMAGTGIYKSTDAGRSFRHMGLTDTQHIARILVHPTNPDVVYVASAGQEYNYGPERGIFKTTDGGETWVQIFFQDEKTGVIDLVMDPSNPETLYAGTADRKRYRWNDPMPSHRSGIHKSSDGGRTWRRLSAGLPSFETNEYERIGLDICRSQPNVVYALLNRAGGAERGRLGAYLYRSDDYGETWRETEGNEQIHGTFSSYGWFFGQVRVDPRDPETVYVMGISLQRTRDGGKTWERIRGNHVDFHGMWINPTDPEHVLAVNDGGLMISHDRLATYRHANNVPIAQLYNISVTQTPGTFRTHSTRQDLGAWMGQVTVRPDRSITWEDWQRGPGDESGRHAVDPTNPDIVYFVNRYGGGPHVADFGQPNPRTGQPPLTRSISPDFRGVSRRAQWVSPLIISSHDPKRIFYGTQFVMLSDDGGENWRRISPDITDFDPAKQGNIAYSTVWAIAESPLRKGLIYAGTDDGLAWVTRDEGANWQRITAGLPAGRFISSVEASRFAEGTIFATVNGKRNDIFETLLFGSADYGRTWTNLTPGLPGCNANVVKEDPTNGNILYLGTDRAVFVSLDRGATWNVLATGLPTVYVHDLVVQTAENVLVIATHGRGAYAIDLLPIRAAAGR